MNNDYKMVYDICKYISSNKHSTEVNELFVEELSELIKAVIKLERYNFCDNSLRCNYHEIYNNIYEELADVTIMMFQFIYKNKISQENLIEEITKKLVRYYETISDKK